MFNKGGLIKKKKTFYFSLEYGEKTDDNKTNKK